MHLGDAQEAVVLGQQGAVGQADAGPHRLTDRAVAEVHLGEVKGQVGGGDHGVDGVEHGQRLVAEDRGGGPKRDQPTSYTLPLFQTTWG